MNTKPRLNAPFFIAAAFTGTLIGAAVLLAASAVHRYRQHRAWKDVHKW